MTGSARGRDGRFGPLPTLGEGGWEPACPSDSLAPDEVQVWRVRTLLPGPGVERLRALLAEDERARADRFHFDRDRRTYTTARGRLRQLLGALLGRPPGALDFRYAHHGKPALAEAPPPLRFNVSHSGDLILLAVSRALELGVDVERERPEPVRDGIADRFFSPAEVASLHAYPEPERVPAFFRCWARKEALLKATGDGLSMPLHQFDVELDPVDEPRLLATRFDPGARDHFSLRAFSPAPGYGGALAVRGHDYRLRLLDWEDE